eukprot:10367871-Alexandrium_andersonii.AAC.1
MGGGHVVGPRVNPPWGGPPEPLAGGWTGNVPTGGAHPSRGGDRVRGGLLDRSRPPKSAGAR